MTEVEEYLRLREAQKSLNKKLLDSLPNGIKGGSMIQRVAKELGYRVKNSTIIFDTEASVDRLYEFLVYEADARGSSVASKYLASGAELPREESLVLRAAAGAAASLYAVTGIDPARKRLCMRDLLRQRDDCWITDVQLSGTITQHGLMYTRVFEVGQICFMSGAALCFEASERDFLLAKCRQLDKVKNVHLRSRKRYALFVRLAKLSSIETRYESTV